MKSKMIRKPKKQRYTPEYLDELEREPEFKEFVRESQEKYRSKPRLPRNTLSVICDKWSKDLHDFLNKYYLTDEQKDLLSNCRLVFDVTYEGEGTMTHSLFLEPKEYSKETGKMSQYLNDEIDRLMNL